MLSHQGAQPDANAWRCTSGNDIKSPFIYQARATREDYERCMNEWLERNEHATNAFDTERSVSISEKTGAGATGTDAAIGAVTDTTTPSGSNANTNELIRNRSSSSTTSNEMIKDDQSDAVSVVSNASSGLWRQFSYTKTGSSSGSNSISGSFDEQGDVGFGGLGDLGVSLADMSQMSLSKSRGVTGGSSARTSGGSRRHAPKDKMSKMATLVERYLGTPRDDETHEVLMPLKIKGGCEVISLGKVVIGSECKNFNSRKYIWPVGFESRRMSQSFKNAGQRTMYTSQILRGDDGRPRFCVRADDATDEPIYSPSSSSAWTTVLKMSNDMKPIGQRRKNVTVSGPEMFGYSDSLIMALFEELPNVKQCDKYWKDRVSFKEKMDQHLKQTEGR